MMESVDLAVAGLEIMTLSTAWSNQLKNRKKKSDEEESNNNELIPLSRKTRPYDLSIGNVFNGEARSLKIPRVLHIPALSVLIVDDSSTQRKLAMKALGGQIDDIMWMIDTAENGERAMQLVERSPRPPDVIIIDQNMESSGGRLLGSEVVARLRSNVYFRSVVIIGCTGFFESAEPHFISAGCDAVWSKPIPSKEVAQMQINNFINLKKKLLQQQMNQRQNLQQTFSFPTTLPGAAQMESKYTEFFTPMKAEGNQDMDMDVPVFQQMKTEFTYDTSNLRLFANSDLITADSKSGHGHTQHVMVMDAVSGEGLSMTTGGPGTSSMNMREISSAINAVEMDTKI